MSVSGSMSGSDGAAGLQAWPGYAVGVSGLGLVVAAAIGGERARERLTGFDFGWRQPLALALAAGAAVTPLVAAGAWLWRGADDPIERSANRVLPEFVAAAADRPDRPRTLVLRPDERGRIAYTLARGAEPTLGDTELTSTPEATARLAGAVSDVASGRGGADADALASFGIRYILLRGGNDSPLVRTLDGVPGLARVGSPEAGVLWQVEAVSSRVRIIASDRLRSEPVAVPSERVGVDTDILAGERNRVVVLAEAADDGWRATLDGRPLPATTVDGWAQGFVVGDSGGRLVIEHRDLMQLALRWLGAAVLGVVLLLALPAIRVSAVDDDDDDELGPA
jgi:hypothetical protein